MNAKNQTQETPVSAPEPAATAKPDKGTAVAQLDAQRQAARMAKSTGSEDVSKVREELRRQAEDAKNFDPARRVARREFDANGAPKSNPRVRNRR